MATRDAMIQRRKMMDSMKEWPQEWQNAVAGFEKSNMAGGSMWKNRKDAQQFQAMYDAWESGNIPQYPNIPQPPQQGQQVSPLTQSGGAYIEAMQTPTNRGSAASTPSAPASTQTPATRQQQTQQIGMPQMQIPQQQASQVAPLGQASTQQGTAAPQGATGRETSSASPAVQYTMGNMQSEMGMSPQTFSPKGRVSSQVSMSGADVQRLQAAGAPVGGNVGSNPYASWAIQDGNMVQTVQEPYRGASPIIGLTDKPTVTSYPINQQVSGNEQLMQGIQGMQQAPGVQEILQGIDPKYAPYVASLIARANEQSAEATQIQQNVQEGRDIYTEGANKLQSDIANISQLAAENQSRAEQRSQDVMSLAATNHEQVQARGEKTVSSLQQQLNDARSIIGAKMDDAKVSAELAWQKAETGLAADMVAARSEVEKSLAATSALYDASSKENWARFDKYSKQAEVQLDRGVDELKSLYGAAWGEAEQKLQDSIDLAKGDVTNLTADRVQASAAGINAAYDDAIRKARAEANMSGDPTASAKVAKLEQVRKQAIAGEVSKARVKYEDAVNGINTMGISAWQAYGTNKAMVATQAGTEIMKATNNFGLQVMATAANLSMRESDIRSALAIQGLNVTSNLEMQGVALSADLKKQRAATASQLGLTDAQFAKELETNGLQVIAGAMNNADMYAAYSGREIINAATTMSQLSQQADFGRVSTDLALAQLSRQGYDDWAKFIQDSPIPIDDSLSLLLADLAGLNIATTFEQESENDRKAQARMDAYSGVDWGQYAPSQDSFGPSQNGTQQNGTQQSPAYAAAKKANANPMPNQAAPSNTGVPTEYQAAMA